MDHTSFPEAGASSIQCHPLNICIAKVNVRLLEESPHKLAGGPVTWLTALVYVTDDVRDSESQWRQFL